jgi:hypothetical protein
MITSYTLMKFFIEYSSAKKTKQNKTKQKGCENFEGYFAF